VTEKDPKNGKIYLMPFKVCAYMKRQIQIVFNISKRETKKERERERDQQDLMDSVKNFGW